MDSKILSVIVPSYNMEAYLPKCLGSLIINDKDLLRKLDVIVVNDGSKDHTSVIAHDFEAKYPGVFRVIDKENGHYGSCINAALPGALGKYVKILDADDSVDTPEFEKLLQVIAEECSKHAACADLIVSDYVTVDPEGKVLSKSNLGLMEDMSTLREQKDWGGRLTIHAICYRTHNLHRIEYRQSEGVPYTDVEWYIEPMITVKRMRYVPIVATRYLIGRDGQTIDAKIFAKNFQVILDLTERLVERYEGNASKCEEFALDYYRKQIMNMLHLCYRCGLFGFGKEKVRVNLHQFDAHLAHFPLFYQETGLFSCGPNHFRFRYVAFFRKYGFGLIWKLRSLLNTCLLETAKVILRSNRH